MDNCLAVIVLPRVAYAGQSTKLEVDNDGIYMHAELRMGTHGGCILKVRVKYAESQQMIGPELGMVLSQVGTGI